LGVPKDSAEALKWYRKAAGLDKTATLELAEMYATGEGTKEDRPEAFVMYVQAGILASGEKGPLSIALSLWQQMDKSERKKAESKLEEHRLDAKKVVAALPELPKP
jgi:TPR repeat protein